MKHKKIAIAGFAASMLAGAGTGLILNIPGGAGASTGVVPVTTPDDGTDETGTTDTTDTTETTVAAGTADDGTDIGRPDRGVGFDDSLAELVAAGTITQAQADAIISAFEANRPEGGPGFGPGHGPGFGPDGGHGPGFGGGHRGFGRGTAIEAAATALGITADELKTELEAGKTIADVATDRSIAVQTVIDSIVAAETADITERVTNMVNGVKPVPSADVPDAGSDDATTATTTG